MIIVQLNIAVIRPQDQKPTVHVCQACGWTGPLVNAQLCPVCDQDSVAQLYNQKYIPTQFTMEWFA
jgi:hypothetical protein